MWTIVGSSAGGPFCDRLSRRSLLKVGALAGTGLSLPDALRSGAFAATTDQAQRRSVIQVFLAGGPSQFETFDPKPSAPADIRGPFGPIATTNPALKICEILPRLAEQAHRYSIVRSCCHDNPGHGGGQRFVVTGHKSASLENELPHDYPAAGAVSARVRGPIRDGMPHFLLMGGSAVEGQASYLGAACEAFKVYATGKPVGLELAPSIALARLNDRRRLRASFDGLRRTAETGRLMDSIDTFEQHAYEMLTSSRVREAFSFEREPAPLRARYGHHEAGQTCLLARRFVEAGAGFVSIRYGNWDHHGNAGGTVTSGMQSNGPPMDQAVAALIEDLAQRGLSEQVLVLVWGEFGRTPRINQFAGRDHWPGAMSVLLAGGGLKTGQIVGATCSKGESPLDRRLSPTDVLATVYRQLGIDPTKSFVNTAGRPIPILDDGTPIAELM